MWVTGVTISIVWRPTSAWNWNTNKKHIFLPISCWQNVSLRWRGMGGVDWIRKIRSIDQPVMIIEVIGKIIYFDNGNGIDAVNHHHWPTSMHCMRAIFVSLWKTNCMTFRFERNLVPIFQSQRNKLSYKRVGRIRIDSHSYPVFISKWGFSRSSSQLQQSSSS